MKVVTTKESSKRGINLKGLGILPEGIFLDLPEERAKQLMGDNAYGLKFVEPLKPITEPVEEVKEEVKEEPVKEEKPVKKDKKAKK